MGTTGLFTAVSGLQSAQASLYTTGHNMANHSTRGFTRQHVAQSTFLYRTIGRNATGALQIGLGTNMQGIRQIRDKFLDMRWRDAAPQMHFWEVRYSTGLELDAIFGEMEGQYRLQGVLRDLNQAMHELLKEPNSIESRGNFIHFAGTFLGRVEDSARSMRAYQDELNNQVKQTVQRINQLLTEIDRLNRQITSEELGGSNANDLRDWRNNALDELSTLLDVQYNVDARTGAYNIWMDGHVLLSGGHLNQIGLRFSAPGSPFVEPVFTGDTSILQFDSTGRNATALFNWDRLSHTESDALPNRGTLFGLLVSRGLSPVTYASAPPPTPNEILSEMMPDLIAEINAMRLDMQTQLAAFMADPLAVSYIDPTNLNTYLAPGGALDVFITALGSFAINLEAHIQDPSIPLLAMPTMPTPPLLVVTGTPSATDLASVNAMITNFARMINTEVRIFSDTVTAANREAGRRRFDVNHGVITRTHIQLDTMVNSLVNMFNSAFTTDVLDLGLPQNLHGDTGIPLFVQIRPGEGYALGNLELNPMLLGREGPSHLPLQFTDALSGESDTRLVAWMIAQWESPDLIQFNDWVSMSVDTFYRNFITEMATATNEAGSFFRGKIEEMNSLDQRRLQISGVSLEEEMSNMIRFQHAYNASARMINTLDSMLDRIINHMGR